MRRGRERGFALVAALVAMLAFAAFAFQLFAQGRATVAVARAELDRARLEAAADAGLALAIDGLARPPGSGRWRIDSVPRRVLFEGVPLTIVVEDERGKIPLNLITRTEARRMFEAAGLTGQPLIEVTDAFLDWRDDDDERRPFGAEAPDYAPAGRAPRNGAMRTVEELASVRGVTPQVYAAIAPAATVFFGESGGFSERNAQPLALAVMTASGLDGPAIIERQRELRGQRTAFGLDSTEYYTGRAMTVRVVADGGDGARVARWTVVELTGNRREPFWVRARG